MSRYAKFLDRLIEQSGMTLGEIVEKCEKIGQPITISYLSKLKNGKMPPPSYKISAALSVALDHHIEMFIALSKLDEWEIKNKELEEALKIVYPDMNQKDLWAKTILISKSFTELQQDEIMSNIKTGFKGLGFSDDQIEKIIDAKPKQNESDEILCLAKEINSLPEEKRNMIKDLLTFYKSQKGQS